MCFRVLTYSYVVKHHLKWRLSSLTSSYVKAFECSRLLACCAGANLVDGKCSGCQGEGSETCTYFSEWVRSLRCMITIPDENKHFFGLVFAGRGFSFHPLARLHVPQLHVRLLRWNLAFVRSNIATLRAWPEARHARILGRRPLGENWNKIIKNIFET